MTDGPLIVQSDKTLLLEVDHPDADGLPAGDRAVRRAGARPRARPHLPADPAGPVERAGRRARRRAGGRRPARVLALPGAARPARRRRRDDGPVRPAAAAQAPDARAGAARPRRPGARGGAAQQEGRSRWSAPGSTTRPSLVHPSERGHLKQVLLKLGWPAEDLAGYVDGEAHPIELAEDGWSLRPYQHAGGRRASGTAAPASSCCPAAPARRSSARPRWPGPQATTLILVTNTVAARQWRDELLRPHHPDRGRDRRVLRRPQGDPPGHDRDLPGADDQAEGRLQPPGAVRRPRLGPDHLRRGAPAAGADLPDDRRPAGPPPARPDRDAGARGRPRGRRLLPDRAEAVRRARGRTSRRRATSPRPTASRSGSRCPSASGWSTPRPSPRSATGCARPARQKTRGRRGAGPPARRASRRW